MITEKTKELFNICGDYFYITIHMALKLLSLQNLNGVIFSGTMARLLLRAPQPIHHVHEPAQQAGPLQQLEGERGSYEGILQRPGLQEVGVLCHSVAGVPGEAEKVRKKNSLK